MAHIQPVIKAELDPSKPVHEVCAVIQALIAYHSTEQVAILRELREAIERSLEQMKGADGIEPIRESSREQQNQG